MSRSTAPRVAFVSHSPYLAGAERVLVSLLEHLPPGQIQPVVIFPAADGPVKALAKAKLPFPIFELPYGFAVPTGREQQLYGRLQQEADAFAGLYRELELDAVVVNTLVIYPASAGAVRARIPLLVHCHGPLLPRAFPGLELAASNRLDMLQFQMADRVLVPSQWVYRHSIAVCKVAESRIRVLVNGTELHPPLDDEDGFRASEVPEFVMLTTLEPQKGVPLFLEAAAIFLARRPAGARFVVYGDGAPDYKESLSRSIRERNLAHDFFLRPKQDVDPIYRRCRGAIVASEFETFSMVAIEAMSYGRPVIATRSGGPEEIVEDERTGYLVPVGDSAAMADRMLRLAENPALSRDLGSAGRNRVRSTYDIDLIAREYLANILYVVDKPRDAEAVERMRVLEALIGMEPQRTGVPGVRSARAGAAGHAVPAPSAGASPAATGTREQILLSALLSVKEVARAGSES